MWRKILRIFIVFFISAIALIAVIITAIRIPVVQNKIIGIAIEKYTNQHGGSISIEKFQLTYKLSLEIDGLEIYTPEDKQLVKWESLILGIDLWPLLRKKANLHVLKLSGLQINVEEFPNGDYSFSYLLPKNENIEELDETPLDSASYSDSSDWEITWNSVTINQTALQFKDAQECTYTLDFRNLSILPKEISGEIIHISQLSWENVKAKIDRKNAESQDDVEEEPSEDPKLKIIVEKLEIPHLDVHYIDATTDAHITWDAFNIDNFSLDFSEKEISSRAIAFTELNTEIHLSPETSTASETIDNKDFQLPDWNINLGTFRLQSKGIALTSNQESQVDIAELLMHFSDIHYSNKQNQPHFGLLLQQLNLDMADVPKISNLNFALEGKPNEIALKNLSAMVNQAQAKLNFNMFFDKLEDVFQNPEQAHWSATLNIENLIPANFTQEGPEELLRLPYLISSNISSKGLHDIQLDNLQLTQASGLQLQVNGKALDITDSIQRKIAWNVHSLDLHGSFWRSIQAEYDLDVLPKRMHLSSSGNYQSEALYAKVALRSPGIELNANLNQAKEKYFIDGNILTQDLADIPSLESSFKIALYEDWGRETNWDIQIQNIQYSPYELDSVHLTGEINNGIFQTTLKSTAEQAQVNLSALGRLPGSYFNYFQTTLKLTTKDLELSKFQITQEPFIVQSAINADVTYNNDSVFSIELRSQEVEITTPDFSRDYPPVFIIANATENSVNLNMDFADVKARASSNLNLRQTQNEIREYISTLLTDSIPDYQANNAQIDLSFSLFSGIITNLLSEDLELGKDSLVFQLKYAHQAERKLDGSLNTGKLAYNVVGLENTAIQFSGLNQQASFKLRLDSLFADEYSLGDMIFESEIDRGKLFLRFQNIQDNVYFYNLSGRLSLSKEQIIWRLFHDTLILAGNHWDIPKENSLAFIDGNFIAEKFKLSRENTFMAIETKRNENGSETDFILENFNISNFVSILDADNPPVGGTLNGILHLEKDNNIYGRLLLDSLFIFSQPIADLDFIGKKNKNGGVDFDFQAIGPNLSLTSSGHYDTNSYAFKLFLQRLDLELLEAFGGKALSQTTGSIALKADLSNLGEDLQYEGSLRFNNAGFTINALNAPFRLSNENITLRDKVLHFEKFALKDSEDNILLVTGDVLLDNYLNPDFKLDINAPKFRLLKSTREDNDLFFGDLLMGAEIAIRGNANIPQLNVKANFLNGTKMNLIVPEGEVDLMDRKSVVEIVDRSIPDSIRMARREVYIESGMDIRAQIKADPNTTFRIIIDERAGDMLEITGGADLLFQLDPSGNMQLTGLYEVTRGSYQLNFYDLVQRSFSITKGSNIRWSGDPLMADLNLQAIYELRTAPLDLMIDQVGPNREMQAPYRREQPFEVQLNIKGELTQPDLSFDIDMPENARGAVNGSIYNRLLQLREDENELNQQTFALLVLNQFVPSGKAGPGPGASELARGSASRMLSQQLNQLSDRYVRGVDLEVGLDSYTDHAEGQDRTDLNVRVGKAFLDDRLRVEVGGQFDIEGQRAAEGADQFMGDISLEYSITEDGRYRLKAFRRNDWQGAVEGQIITTGASLLFKREFTTFEELIGYMLKKQRDEQNE
jgi:translocation and assembly module TamB